ncbi:MAG TPA: hypothetical protein ENK44_09015 [Caldithrix abyssi]|uniref:Type IV pilus assembly protein PilO n=1 Tax=Caldithrix abyssi TaxID=187145 RepID=A0A7V4U0T7_CALAY|nr:hypothetical protein [Caldithrix abyssi]
MEKKIFTILLAVLLIISLSWYLFIYSRQKATLEDIESNLRVVAHKLKNAQQAQQNMKLIEENLKKKQENLTNERNRFISESDLPEVTEKLKSFAREYNLELTDFSSSFESLLESEKKTKIAPLALSLTVKGKYLDIGRFLEHWPTLPFYLIPERFNIKRAGEDTNILDATISATLYIWNN